MLTKISEIFKISFYTGSMDFGSQEAESRSREAGEELDTVRRLWEQRMTASTDVAAKQVTSSPCF